MSNTNQSIPENKLSTQVEDPSKVRLHTRISAAPFTTWILESLLTI